METKARILYSKLSIYREIHEMSATLEHAIKEFDSWKPYIPTQFIYTFFTFNTLYNIDWRRSLRKRDICMCTYGGEEYRYNLYLKFCCNETHYDFLIEYKDFFIRCVTFKHSSDEILKLLKNIELDVNDRGSIQDPEQINKFISACTKCLKGNRLDYDILKDILDFIYQIRCNLFHGVKTMDMLKSEAQQKRLEIYTSFIVAINQMIFSYLQFLKGDVITERFDDLLRKLYLGNNKNINRNNNTLLSKARNICLNAHKGQFDKVGQPYHLHPERVASRCATEDEKIVALLHDTIEDTDVTPEYLKEQGFSDKIIKAILSVTKRENENYEEFVARAKMNPIGRYVKMHDLEDNMDLSHLSELTDEMVARQRKYIKAYKFLKE